MTREADSESGCAKCGEFHGCNHNASEYAGRPPIGNQTVTDQPDEKAIADKIINIIHTYAASRDLPTGELAARATRKVMDAVRPHLKATERESLEPTEDEVVEVMAGAILGTAESDGTAEAFLRNPTECAIQAYHALLERFDIRRRS